MTSKRVFLFFFLILVLGIVMRFVGLDTVPPGLYSDEAFYGIDAIDSLANHDFPVFYSANRGREGMFIHLIALSFATFGDSVITLRGVSAVVGSVTLVFIYLLTLEWFRHHAARRQIALVAMFLVAVSFWHLNFSRVAFHGILVPLAQSAGIFCVLRAVRSRSVVWCLFSGIVLGAGIYTSKSFPAIGLLVLLILWFALKDGNLSFKHLAIVSASALLAALPMLLYAWRMPEVFFLRSNEVGLWNSTEVGLWHLSPNAPLVLRAVLVLAKLLLNTIMMLGVMPFVMGDQNWRHNFSPLPELSLLAMFGVICAMRFHRSNTNEGKDAEYARSFWLLVLYAVLTALPAVITNEGIPHASRAIGMIVPLHLLAAWGLYEMYCVFGVRAAASSRRTWTFAAGLLLLTAVGTNVAYFGLWKHRPQTLRAFAFETKNLKDYQLRRYRFLEPYLGPAE